mmetsp:Transcript_27894/g.39916  ORF Transcript_27894/g.39916 Transcript_27894/m.39916 type:complete len:364 (+) Transcript_27894:70-1161(+)
MNGLLSWLPFNYHTRRLTAWMLLLQATIIYVLISPSQSYVPLFVKSQQLWSKTIRTIADKFLPATSEDELAVKELPVAFANEKAVPFIIEKFERHHTDIFNQVSDMCIDIFFQEEVEKASLFRKGRNSALENFILSFPLNYLKDLQERDLKKRKSNLIENGANEMFIAREVSPCYARSAKNNNKKLALFTETKVYNTNGFREAVDYIFVGDIIGFVEVTSKPFALGQGDDHSDTGRLKLRPVLTNLCVKKEGRKSGVGSALLEACEQAVTTWNPSYDEIILEVEEKNRMAQQFYERRGYEVIFADPTSRRYEASGFFVKNVRTTKICMRKKLPTLFSQVSTQNFNLLRFLSSRIKIQESYSVY